MRSTLGMSRDGLHIVASGCNEDNSGIVVALPMGGFEVRCTYPTSATYDDVTGEETPVYNELHNDEKEAVAALKQHIGAYSGW